MRGGVAALAELARLSGGPRLVGAAMLDAAGTGLIMPLSVLFFVIHVGLSKQLVGAGMSIGGAVALVVAPLGGQMVDRFGPKRALVAAWAAAGVSACAFVLVRSWPEMIAVVAALGSATGVSGTARQTLLAGLVESSEISRVMALARAFRNVGYGVGGLLATAALAGGSTGFLVAVYGNAASFLIAAALVVGMRVPVRGGHGAHTDTGITLRTVLTDRRYVAVSLLDCLTNFHQVALQVALPLWVVLFTHAPRALVGVLFTINTATVVIAQVRVSRNVRTLAHTPRTYARAALSMAGAGGAFLAAHYTGAGAAIVLLVIGALLMTGAEMFSAAADWVVSFGLADEHHRGKYLSVYSIGGGLGQAVGPSASTALMSAGAIVTWPAIAAIVACGTLGSGAIAAAASRRAEARGLEAALGG